MSREAVKRMRSLVKDAKRVYEVISREEARGERFEEYHKDVLGALREGDGEVFELIAREYERAENTVQLIAAENQCSKAVLAALGSVVQNKTTEGFAGKRFHGGCEVVDEIERLAIARAKEAFGAKSANVQAHSGTQANQIVMTAILERGDKVLSLGMDQGGHVSHGGALSFSGKFFEVENYCVERGSFLLNYEAIREQAREFGPKLIVCGATAYPRRIDFAKFREIADEVGAYLLADISHISGLVMGGVHQSPVDFAHFTTTSTYKPGGPRGGLILMGKDWEKTVESGGKEVPLWKALDKATFPGVQGTPYLNHIAAKAVFFKEAMGAEYKARQAAIIENAKRLAKNFVDMEYDVLTGGTDNHMVLINVANLRAQMTGVIAQKCLEECGIVINMNKLPYDERNAFVTSGIRLGTPIVTRCGMGAKEMDVISLLVDRILRAVEITGEKEYRLDEDLAEEVREAVRGLCGEFSMV